MTSSLNCSHIFLFSNLAIDGELSLEELTTFEEHLSHCEECREKFIFQKASARSLKDAVLSEDLSAPEELQQQIQALFLQAPKAPEVVSPALSPLDFLNASENDSSPSPKITASPTPTPTPLPPISKASVFTPYTTATLGALALAASVFFAVHFHTEKAQPVSSQDNPLQFMVSEHAKPLPPETQEVQKLEPYVGVPIRAFPLKQMDQSKLVGGRVLPVEHERAAMLQYEVQKQGNPGRVSVFVYDPNKIKVESSELPSRSLGSGEIRVGSSNGYSIAVMQRDGVGYTVASDMDPESTADMAATLVSY